MKFFGSNKKKKRLSQVKVGEYIKIEDKVIKGGIGVVKCLGNDPDSKTILVEFRWKNYKEYGIEETLEKILNYYSLQLENFQLLNQNNLEIIQEDCQKSDQEILNLAMEVAIKKEYYELAEELKNKINLLCSI